MSVLGVPAAGPVIAPHGDAPQLPGTVMVSVTVTITSPALLPPALPAGAEVGAGAGAGAGTELLPLPLLPLSLVGAAVGAGKMVLADGSALSSVSEGAGLPPVGLLGAGCPY